MGLVDGALFAVVLVLPLGALGVGLLAEGIKRRRQGVRVADADGDLDVAVGASDGVAGETSGRRRGLPAMDVVGLTVSGCLALGLALVLSWSFLAT